MKSTIAQTLATVMGVLWGNEEKVEPVYTGIASYVKTHNRHNAENVFDVVSILFSQSLVHIKPLEGERNSSERNFLVEVKFQDGSRALVELVDGIGSSCEPLGDDDPAGDSTLTQD
jgi:hypothetical protein